MTRIAGPRHATVVLAAAAAAVGALHPVRSALVLSGAVGVVALVARRSFLLPVVVALAVSGLGQRALDGLDGVQEGPVVAEFVLVGDPTPSFGGVRVDVRLGGRRFEARAQGVAARALEPRLAGEVVALRGVVVPAEGEPWLTVRHVSGRLRVLAAEGWRPGDPVARAANALRRTLVEGAGPLDARERSLFTGLVLGDDRHQPVDLADAFRGAGLTHLLAVSGQNVAFTLALAGPALRRLRLWPRLLATLGVIALFGVVTRFEPSVLRASVMAALAATLATTGHPAARVRVIAMAVIALLLVDPLLVRSVGFQLSVCAATAIVVVAPRLVPVLPGPAPFRDALAVTLAAQLGVAPVLLATFGPLPVASVPANLLAVPVAGLVMVWGLTAGLVAGAGGAAVAGVAHVPTGLALGWLDLVATRGAAAPLGALGVGHVAALGLGLALMAGRGRPAARHLGRAAVLGALGAAVLAANAPVPLRTAPAPGIVRWHRGDVDVVVLGGAGGRSPLRGRDALEALRRGGVRTLDVLVVADGTVPVDAVRAVLATHPAGAVVAHHAALVDHGIPAVARVPVTGAVVDLGDLTVRFTPVGDRLVVEATARAP